MSPIILYIAMSIDGYIATSDGGVGWLDQFNGTGEDYGYGEFVKSIDCTIQGANTYKQVLGFDMEWPYQCKSFVLTHQKLAKPQNADVEFFKGDIAQVVTSAQKISRKNIWLIGGANLVQSFLKQSLLDEVILFIMPVFLGSGISLFGKEGIPSGAKLVEIHKYDSGVVKLHYTLGK